MGIDTVKLKSPAMDKSIVKKIEQQCIKRSGVHLSTGEILYEITTGNLLGSWDSKISVKPMYEDFIIGKTGRPELVPCEPYIILECSATKAMNGHNVYGAPVNFQATCTDLIELLEELLSVELPPANLWMVRRVDWAEMYRLSYTAIQEFFQGIFTVQFPRRQGQKYGDHAVYFPGTTTTVKLYHKGPEFAKHDAKRLKYFLTAYRTQQYPQATMAADNCKWITRKLEAMQRLANNRLRVEVEIHADKLDFDFGRKPFVADITDEYLEQLHEREITRLLREGKSDIKTVRRQIDVARRLNTHYGEVKGGHLLGFWMRLAGLGEDEVKRSTNRATFYRQRKQLVDAGVSWHNADVRQFDQGALPPDFTPIRTDPRRCNGGIRAKPAYLLERNLLKLVA